ncbi:MAG TPA: histidine kinase [Methylotenera sp.]|nr:histidine kinase [Methylotenera sp.]
MKISNYWQQIKVSHKDVVKALIFVLLAFFITLQINLAELLTEKLSKYEKFQLDEIPFLLLFIAMALAWFAWRRVIEQKKEAELRLIAEEKSTRLLIENRSLTQHILKVQEFERLELARDLHDDIGQYLLAIRLDASSLTNDGDADSHPARRILSNAGHIQNMAKSLMRRLRPAPTNSKNCIDGIQLMVQEWLERQPNINVILSINESVRFFSDQTLEKDEDFIELISVTIYRFLQEALTNIAKHAQANQVEISLDIVKKNLSSDVKHLCIEIKDDGKGFDTQVATSIGMGMIGMRERISAVNGEYLLRNNSPTGLVVCAKIPIKYMSSYL